jgi:hypothetical protein
VTDPRPFRDQPNPRKQRDVESALHLLRQVNVPYGLNERVEARLNAARLIQKTAVPSPWFRTRIAASVLAVAVTSGALAVHYLRSVPEAAVPSATRHLPAPGVQAAGAIRVPVKPVEAPATGESRTARVRSNARARHNVLPRGTAAAQHAAEAAEENSPTEAPRTTTP